jgi:3-oxosteroid 1-dehydrogenase
VPKTQSFDVAVVGSGFPGLATALLASKAGLSTVVLEKADKVGGCSSHSYGILWVGSNHIARAAGMDDPADDVSAYLSYVEGGHGHKGRMRAFQKNAPRALKALSDCGLRFDVIKGLADHYDGRAPGAKKVGRSVQTPLFATPELGKWRDRLLVPDTLPRGITCEELISWGGITNSKEWHALSVSERVRDGLVGLGPGLVGHVLKELLQRGVPIYTGCGATRLLDEGGRVSGLEDAQKRRIKTRKGVVLATGGYDSNPQMIRDLEGVPGWVSLSPESVTGDGLVMAQELGAAVKVMRDKLDFFLGFSIPKKSKREPAKFRLAGISELFCPHTMVVNGAGQRFGDESYFQGLVPMLRKYDVWNRKYENLPCYLILDSQYFARFAFAGGHPGDAPPSWVARSDTVAGLAKQLGVDGATLERTVARFNRFVDEGQDQDFHRGEERWTLAAGDLSRERANRSLGKISQPPFCGVELRPSGSSTTGITANEAGQAMHVRGRPIAGLYAIGNAAARDEYGVGYQAGFTLSAGMTFGYLAVQHMLSH